MKQLGQILVLEDDRRFLESLDFSLGSEYRLHLATSITEAELILESKPVDVILLDYHLGSETGHDFLDRLQRRQQQPPVIVVSGHINLEMAVGFLKRRIAGFLEKPVALPELKKAINTVLAAKTEKRHINADGFKVNFATRNVTMNSSEVSLTPTEFELLAYFLGKPGEQISRQSLILHLWGDAKISKNALDTHLLNLKKKLPPFADKLVSVYGAGYCYEP